MARAEDAEEAGVGPIPIAQHPTRGSATTSTLASGCNNNEGARYWFKLTRAGNVFTSYWSSNGTTWTLGASQTITGMPTTLRAGLPVSAHSTSVLNIATFDNVTIAQRAGGLDSDD